MNITTTFASQVARTLPQLLHHKLQEHYHNFCSTSCKNITTTFAAQGARTLPQLLQHKLQKHYHNFCSTSCKNITTTFAAQVARTLPQLLQHKLQEHYHNFCSTSCKNRSSIVYGTDRLSSMEQIVYRLQIMYWYLVNENWWRLFHAPQQIDTDIER